MLNFPRALGALAALWGIAVAAEGFTTGESVWLLVSAAWIAAASFLFRLSLVGLTGPVMLALIGFEFVIRTRHLTGLDLLAWLAVIAAVTDERPRDRALLLRGCVTVLYGFAALSKLNPSWLAGEGVIGLITNYEHLESLHFVGASPGLAVATAVSVICLEAWMAAGLWFRRTRVVTAGVGVCLHLAFIVLASSNVWAVVHLTVLNLGVVACYPAFWSEYRERKAAAPPPIELAPDRALSTPR